MIYYTYMNDYFLSLAGELLSKYKRVNSFTPHTLSVGRYHEEALKSTLRLFLPTRFSIKTGFVHIPQTGVTSKQCDLIIIDENEPNSYFFQDGEFVIVHPEAVVCVIEVKTNITKEEFGKIHKAAKALSDVRKKKRGQLKGCLYLAFGYTSTLKGKDERLGSWYRDLPKINDEEYDLADYPMEIVSLEGGLGVLQLAPGDDPNWGMRKIYKEGGDTPEWRLALFLMAVRTLTEMRDGRTEFSNVEWGVSFEGAKLSTNRFRAGEGLVNKPYKG